MIERRRVRRDPFMMLVVFDDGLDLGHGTRSVDWMKAHAPVGMSPETVDIATYINQPKQSTLAVF